MTTQKTLVVSLLMWASTAVAQDEIGFKSLSFGATQEAYKAEWPDHVCRTSEVCSFVREAHCTPRTAGPADGAICAQRNTWAGVAIKSVVANFVDGRLARVNIVFDAARFEHVLEASKQRYGQPSMVSSTPVQTRMGARYENTVATWDRPGTVMALRRYAGTITESNASLMTREEFERVVSRARAAPKEGAKDM